MGGYPMWRGLLGIPPVRVGPTPEQPPTPPIHTRSLAQITDAHIALGSTTPYDIRRLPSVAGAARLIASTIDQIPLSDTPEIPDPRSVGGDLDMGDVLQHCIDSMLHHGRAYLWCTQTQPASPTRQGSGVWRLEVIDPQFVQVRHGPVKDMPWLSRRTFWAGPTELHEVPYTALNSDGGRLLHIPYVVTVDQPEGTTPLMQAANILRGHVHTEAQTAAMFTEGGTHVGGVLSTDADITPAQAKDWQAAWVEARAARRTPVIGNGLTYRNEAPNAVDLQLVEARSFNQSVVWALLGIPLAYMGSSLMGGQSSLSYANAPDNRRPFADNCLRAFTTQIEDAISRLLPYGSRAAFDYTEWEGRADDGAPTSAPGIVPPA